MKKQGIFYVLTGLVAITAITFSCTREEPVEPIAEFTTNLEDNTAYAGQSFYMYLENAQGDFLTLFTGTSASKVYSPDDGSRSGTSIDPSLDSFEVTTYNNAGTYRMTLVASSSGNWAEDYVQDTFGIDLTVIDSRVGFSSFEIDGQVGTYSDDGNSIFFVDHKNADLTAIAPKFSTSSSAAVVTVDGVEQISQESEVDFSPTTPGADQGRPVEYVVTAPSGESQTYTVQFNLREPSSEKRLFSINTSVFGNVVLSAENEANKEVKLVYDTTRSITSVKTTAVASDGAKVFILDDDGEPQDVAADDEKVDFKNSGVITVEAEDGSTQEYDIRLYGLEAIETISIVEAGGAALNPTVAGTIDEEAGTIVFNVVSGTDLATLVMEYTGLSKGALYLGPTELVSGTTAADFSSSPVLEIRADDGTVLGSYSVTINVAK